MRGSNSSLNSEDVVYTEKFGLIFNAREANARQVNAREGGW